METAITTAFPRTQNGHNWQPKVVRFAADLVVLHRDKEVIVQTTAIASEWLQEAGLTLKPSKTRMAHTLHPIDGVVGFNFLGFYVRQYPVGKYKTGKDGHGRPLGFKTWITPSKQVSGPMVTDGTRSEARARGLPRGSDSTPQSDYPRLE